MYIQSRQKKKRDTENYTSGQETDYAFGFSNK